jgi:hypothetical protein
MSETKLMLYRMQRQQQQKNRYNNFRLDVCYVI